MARLVKELLQISSWLPPKILLYIGIPSFNLNLTIITQSKLRIEVRVGWFHLGLLQDSVDLNPIGLLHFIIITLFYNTYIMIIINIILGYNGS